MEKKPKIVFEKAEDAFLLSHDHSADFEKYIDLLDCNEICYEDGCELIGNFNFDTLMEFINSIRMVRLDKKNWKLSQCTCIDYFKTYVCKHIITIAISQKRTVIPEKFFDSVIGQKPKPGRKKKARAWNVIQNN